MKPIYFTLTILSVLTLISCKQNKDSSKITDTNENKTEMKTDTLNQNDLIKEIENLHKNFNSALSQFSEEELNKIPFEGSWTAGQVAEHISKSNGGILE